MPPKCKRLSATQLPPPKRALTASSNETSKSFTVLWVMTCQYAPNDPPKRYHHLRHG